MTIIWSPTSRRKIDEILDYISADNVVAALALVEEFERRVDTLKQHPRLGRKSPVFKDERIRELIIRKTYLIVYKITGSDAEGEIRIVEIPVNRFFIATLFEPQW